MMLWGRTIRGFAFIFGDAYVLFGVVTFAFVIPSCGQETKWECLITKNRLESL